MQEKISNQRSIYKHDGQYRQNMTSQPVQLTRALPWSVCRLSLFLKTFICQPPELARLPSQRYPRLVFTPDLVAEVWTAGNTKNIKTTVSKKDNQISSSQLAVFLHLIPPIVIATNRQNVMNDNFANSIDNLHPLLLSSSASQLDNNDWGPEGVGGVVVLLLIQQ